MLYPTFSGSEVLLVVFSVTEMAGNTSSNQSEKDAMHATGSAEVIKGNPWLMNSTSFHTTPLIHKSDLMLQAVTAKFEDGCLIMPPEAHVLVEMTWGYCLLGFYGGRFPGKDATQKVVSRWSRRCKVSYHPNGWIIFQFATEEDREVIRNLNTRYVFGIPLILCSLPDNFRFDASPEFKFRTWISLPNLPLHYWNPVGISWIVASIGEPLEVDRRTVLKDSIAAARA